MLRFLLLGFIAMSLAGCGNSNPFYAPTRNPHPKYFMTVSGYMAPELQKTLHPQLVTDYETKNPNCQYNTFETSFAYDREITTDMTPNQSGHYVAKVPLDYFKLGRCQWNISGISLITAKGFYGTLVSFRLHGKASSTVSKERPQMDICPDVCRTGRYEIFSENALPINQNYFYTVNYWRNNI